MAGGSLSSRGFEIIALSPEWQELVARAWREYDDFATYTLFERNHVRLLSSPQQVPTFDSLCETSLLHTLVLGGERTVRNADGKNVKMAGAKLAEYYTGQPHAFYLNQSKFGRNVWIPRAQGMGRGTAFFSGRAHLRLQLELVPHVRPATPEVIPDDAVRRVEALAGKLVADVATLGDTWVALLDAQIAGRSLTARMKRLDVFRRELRDALMQREARVQAQIPHNSILAFLDRSVNERLFHVLVHPTGGLEGLRAPPTETTSGPREMPLPEKGRERVVRFNDLCEQVHGAYHGSPDPRDTAESAALRAWVEKRRPFLARFARELGLDAAFVQSRMVQPELQGEGLLLWQGYHHTVGHHLKGGVPKVEGLKRTIFLDGVPRNVFHEDVWACVWACHARAIMDLGGGCYRGSTWEHAYHRARGLPTGATALVPEHLWPRLGAPTSSADDDMVLVPERFRLKEGGRAWDCLHKDCEPLPRHMEAALQELDSR